MNSVLFESPYIVGGAVAILLIIVWYAWLKSGNPVAFYVALVATLIGGGLITANITIETDREVIAKSLQDAANAVQENRFDDVLEHVSPHATAALAAITSQFVKLQFREARITRIHAIEVDETTTPKTAQVRMNVYVDGDLNNFTFRSPRWMLLDLEEDLAAKGNNQSGKPAWRVIHVEHREPHHEFINR